MPGSPLESPRILTSGAPAGAARGLARAARALPLLLFLPLGLSAACTGGLVDSRGRPDLRELGPEGGVLLSRDGACRVVFPPGAVESVALFSLSVEAAPEGALGPGYRVSPEDAALALPITVAIRQAPAAGFLLPAEVGRVDETGALVPLETILSPEEGRRRAESGSLGLFAAYQPDCEGDSACTAGNVCADGRCHLACVTSAACEAPEVCTAGACCIDADGDGACAEVDCRETDPDSHPGATERCNARDDDCDGSTDEDPACTFVPESGCADGGREGFVSETTYPGIAACSGAFEVPGVTAFPMAPTCARAAGDDGGSPDGWGCSAVDLCAEGWHLCSRGEVAARSPTGCAGATPPGTPDKMLFFASRESSPAEGRCVEDGGGDNDVFGCGNLGRMVPADRGCAPLDRALGGLQEGSCSLNEAEPPLGPWECPGVEGDLHEASNVTKIGCPNWSCSYSGQPQGSSDKGGVLCCAD